MTARNLLIYAETGNVESVLDIDGNGTDSVNITIKSDANNNGDIRIQAGMLRFFYSISFISDNDLTM